MLEVGVLIFFLLLPAVCGWAFWLGGRAERLAAAGLLVAVLLSIAVGPLAPSWSHPQVAIMTIDAGLCVFLFRVALESERFWPQWATAAQLAGTVTHLIRVFDPMVGWRVYAALQPAWAFVVLLTISIGVMQERSSHR